jgi:2-dehydro-3-deoxy-D-arabinonate dehydratase
MLLYRTQSGPVLQTHDQWFRIERDWESLVNDDELANFLTAQAETRPADAALADAVLADAVQRPLAPLGDRQEVWAAGVTYLRSKTARMEEAEAAGGGDFYDRVYAAPRPEIFFKATPHRVAPPGAALHLRRDSTWIVPEPELTLVVTRTGKIVGYTAGNDLSCRDIEGENPLYLPQAKTFDRCASVGPAILVALRPLAPATAIAVTIRRGAATVFAGATTLAQMKRTPEELVGFLFRDNSHPHGCLLMTGTGIVPPDDFSLRAGDVVEISVDGVGTLANPME